MPEQNSTSHPTPEQSIQALLKSLKPVHPINLQAGAEALTVFISEQMRDPEYKGTHAHSQLEKDALMFPHLFDCCFGDLKAPTAEGVTDTLRDYAKLLYAVNIKLYELQSDGAAGALEASDEIIRIADPLGINVFDEDVEAHGLLRESALAPAQKPTAFDRCAQFDETLRRYQKSSESLLRGFSLRVSDLVQRCSSRIVPAQREAAGVLNRKIETAVEAIKAQ